MNVPQGEIESRVGTIDATAVLDMPIEWRKEASTGHARESDSRF